MEGTEPRVKAKNQCVLISTLLILLPFAALTHEFKAGDFLIDHLKIVETPPAV